MASLEATMERIQQLRGLGLAAHHVVNSFLRHNIASLQQCSCLFWAVLTQEHETKLNQESPPLGEIIRISNFLVGGNQLWRPWDVYSSYG
jgi:hypothetical protein